MNDSTQQAILASLQRLESGLDELRSGLDELRSEIRSQPMQQLQNSLALDREMSTIRDELRQEEPVRRESYVIRKPVVFRGRNDRKPVENTEDLLYEYYRNKLASIERAPVVFPELKAAERHVAAKNEVRAPQKIKNGEIHTINTNDTNSKRAFVSMVRDAQTVPGASEFFFQLGDNLKADYDADVYVNRASTSEFMFPGYQQNSEHHNEPWGTIDGFRYGYVSNTAQTFVDCGEEDPIYLTNANYYLPLLLPVTSAGKFGNSVTNPDQYNTFRKFCTSVYESNRNTEYAGLVDALFGNQSFISAEAMFRLIGYFVLYHEFIHEQDIYDTNDELIAMKGLQVENVEGDPENSLASFAPELSMIIKTDISYLGAGSADRNTINYLYDPFGNGKKSHCPKRYDLSKVNELPLNGRYTVFNPPHQENDCAASLFRFRYNLDVKTVQPSFTEVLLWQLYLFTKGTTNKIITTHDHCVYNCIPYDAAHRAQPNYVIEDVNYYLIDNCWYAGQNGRLFAKNNCTRNDGILHTSLKRFSERLSLKCIQPGTSDFGKAEAVLDSNSPSYFVRLGTKISPMICHVTEPSDVFIYHENHLSMLVDLAGREGGFCPRCQQPRQHNWFKCSGLMVCRKCHNDVKFATSTQPTMFAAWDIEACPIRGEKSDSFAPTSVAIAICRDNRFKIPLREQEPLTKEKQERIKAQYEQDYRAWQEAIQEMIADGIDYTQAVSAHPEPTKPVEISLTQTEIDNENSKRTDFVKRVLENSRRMAVENFSKLLSDRYKTVVSEAEALEVIEKEFNFEVVEFTGEDCLEQFADFLVEEAKKHNHYCLFAHNGSRYDNLIFIQKLLTKKREKYFDLNRIVTQGSQVIKYSFAGHLFFDFTRYVPESLERMCESLGLPNYLRKRTMLNQFRDPFTGEAKPIATTDFFKLEPVNGFTKVADWDTWLDQCGVKSEFSEYGKYDVISLLCCILMMNGSLMSQFREQILSISLHDVCMKDGPKLNMLEIDQALMLNNLRYCAIIKPTLGSWVMAMSKEKEKRCRKLYKRLREDYKDISEESLNRMLALLTIPVIKFTEDGKDEFSRAFPANPLDLNEIQSLPHLDFTAINRNGMSEMRKLPTQLQQVILASRYGGISLVRKGYEGIVEFPEGAVLLDVRSLYPFALMGVAFLKDPEVNSEFPECFQWGTHAESIIKKFFPKNKNPSDIFPVVADSKKDIKIVGGPELKKILIEDTDQPPSPGDAISLDRIGRIQAGFYKLRMIVDNKDDGKWISVIPGYLNGRLNWECEAIFSRQHYEANKEVIDKYLQNFPPEASSIKDSIYVDHIQLAMLKYYKCGVLFDVSKDAVHYIFGRCAPLNFSYDLLRGSILRKMREDAKPASERCVVTRHTSKNTPNIYSGKANENPYKEQIVASNNVTFDDLSKGGDCVKINETYFTKQQIANEGIPNLLGELCYSVSKMFMFHFFESVNWEFYRVETDSLLCGYRWVKTLTDQGMIGNSLGQLDPESLSKKDPEDYKITTAYLLGPKTAFFKSSKGTTKSVFKGFPSKQLKEIGDQLVFENILRYGNFECSTLLNFDRKLFGSQCGVAKRTSVKCFDYAERVLDAGKVISTEGKLKSETGKVTTYESGLQKVEKLENNHRTVRYLNCRTRLTIIKVGFASFEEMNGPKSIYKKDFAIKKYIDYAAPVCPQA